MEFSFKNKLKKNSTNAKDNDDNGVISSCVLGDFIHRRNVISKTYVLPMEQIQSGLVDFMSSISEVGATPSALPFFIMDIMKNEWVKVKFYMPVEQSFLQMPSNMHFDSYFSVENMVAVCVSKEPAKNMSDAYVKIFDFLQSNSLRAITPIFHVLGGDKEQTYTILKVGYQKIN